MKSIILVLILMGTSAHADLNLDCTVLTEVATADKLVAGFEQKTLKDAYTTQQTNPSPINQNAVTKAELAFNSTKDNFLKLCISVAKDCNDLADQGVEQNLLVNLEHQAYLDAKKKYEGQPYGNEVILGYFQQEQYMKQQFLRDCYKNN